MVSVCLCNVRIHRRVSSVSFTHYLQHRGLVSGKKRVSNLHSDYLRYLFLSLFCKPVADCSTPGPRFSLAFLQYYLHRSPTTFLPTIVFFFGIVRTLSCGGWVFVTSTDNHDVHDFMMILYVISNIPWMLVGTATTPPSRMQLRKRRSVVLFFSITPPI